MNVLSDNPFTAVKDIVNNLKNVVDMITNILKAYPGNDQAFIKDTDSGKLFSMGITTRINPTMLNELCGILGESNIKVAE
ncbi:MAG: hypothetical protein IJY70_00780 [Clostridia bacterium]|nr:hypothetical protein [Clostridia bacterium]